MKIAFLWQGIREHFNHWDDGLKAAMRHIEKEHTVRYFEPTDLDLIHEFKPDRILYWEALCTRKSFQDSDKFEGVANLPFKKALAFAGGPVEAQWTPGFDLFFVESKINAEEFERLGLSWKTAFGVNDETFKQQKQPKKFEGILHATFAGWKRHGLFAEALGSQGVAVGRKQVHEPFCYESCEQKGVLVLEEVSSRVVSSLINSSHTVVNTSEFWGGGQRCTLEAMACNVPPIVMADSPKNREYVEESGFGVVVDPNPGAIREGIEIAKQQVMTGRDYINSKWTAKHYADSLIKGLSEI